MTSRIVPEAVERLGKRCNALQTRAALKRALRKSFDDRGWLEVDTPVRIEAPAPEEFIETIPASGAFLRPSPELEMKLLLAAGYEHIYQIGPCFRAEEFGRKHRTEFTMLEYYAVGMDYRELALFTAELLREAAVSIFGSSVISYQGQPLDLGAPPEFITVADAYQRWCGMSVEAADEYDCFDELMVTNIEPQLGQGHITILTDYPANRASLARLKPENPLVAERWEMYLFGVELANAYGELRDPREQRMRFDAAAAFRAKNGMQPYPEPTDFYQALEYGMPPVSGSALGFDRLSMIFADVWDIADVRCE